MWAAEKNSKTLCRLSRPWTSARHFSSFRLILYTHALQLGIQFSSVLQSALQYDYKASKVSRLSCWSHFFVQTSDKFLTLN